MDHDKMQDTSDCADFVFTDVPRTTDSRNPEELNSFANLLIERFQESQRVDDIDCAISIYEWIIKLTP